MNVRSKKELSSKILKAGKSRVRVESDKDVMDAITRNDIRVLIKKGKIRKVQKKGTTRKYAKETLKQKRKGRKKGEGSRKGAAYSRKTKKTLWIEKVRALRSLAMNLRDTGKIHRSDYRRIYLMIKGGQFRNKKHLLFYLKDKELLVNNEKKKKA
jgi:large subunit ribosomal protein L19e